MKTLELKDGNSLVLVAHPDDETIWMAGAILKFQNLKWTIFSLSRSDDMDRSPKFKKACLYYGARAVISDLEDEGLLNTRESLPEIEQRIRRELKQKRFTYIFTHGYNGEYGHPRHKGAHQALQSLIRRKIIIADEIYNFSYELRAGQKFATPRLPADYYLKLPREIFREKKRIIENIYGFKKSSFESRSCSQIETFNLKNWL